MTGQSWMQNMFLGRGWATSAIAWGVGAIALVSDVTLAQVIPDNTLGAESSQITNLDQLRERIDGGALRGSNLFHSFLEFNVGEGRGVYFANPAGIEHILSRVTGGNTSQILGRLGVLGGANLFLLNPNGIIFGPNASLDIQGSFFATTADGIKLGEEGFFSATEPQSSNLLAVNPGALFFNQAASHGGNIINRGNLAVGGDLTLSAGNLDLQGQLYAGGNLRLEALDKVQIRDTVTSPFVAAAVGDLWIQGNQSVDIFALNHPASGLVSGEDMVLRSGDAVIGDAHYWSGGSFRIEKLDGTLGNLISPNDPIIQTKGDVAFFGYQGASLHIIAGGSVDINTIIIIGTDTGENTINPISTPELANVILSDGTILVIDGSSKPTLDIRSGVDPSVISSNFITREVFTISQFDLELLDVFNLIVEPFDFLPNPANANITIGDIFMLQNGLVLLTNQYQSNLSLLQGNILINGSDAFTNGAAFTNGIDARGFDTNGTDVIIDARGKINLSGVDINANSDNFKGGNITLLSGQDIVLTSLSNILSLGGLKGGDINLTAQGNIYIENSAINPLTSESSEEKLGNTGNVDVKSNLLSITQTGQIQSNTFIDKAGGSINIIANFMEIDGYDGQIFSGILSNTYGMGDAGEININVGQLLISNGGVIRSNTYSMGDAGEININVGQLLISDGGVIASLAKEGSIGNTGNISIKNAQLVHIKDELSEVANVTLGSGDAKDIKIATDKLIVENGAIIQSITFDFVQNEDIIKSNRGDSGNIAIDSNQSVEVNNLALISTSNFGELAVNSGKIEINTSKLHISNSKITTGSVGNGNAGNLTINASDLIKIDKNSSVDTNTEGQGDAGELTLTTSTLIIRDSDIQSGTIGDGNSGNLNINASNLIDIGGQKSSISTSTEGQGNAGVLTLKTSNLIIFDGAEVSSGTRSNGMGGDLIVMGFGSPEADFVQVIGTDFNSKEGSLLTTETAGNGNAGNLMITTKKILVEGGASVTSRTVANGNGGQILINASEELKVAGISADGITSSSILANSQELYNLSKGTGNAGNITIQTDKFIVANGAFVAAQTFGKGDAGNITINATDSIRLDGITEMGSRSGLSTEATDQGVAGSIYVETNQLLIQNDATIATNTQGIGNAGNVQIIADQLQLVEGGSISSTTSGEGNAGTIKLNIKDTIQLRDEALIQASTEGIGNAGDIHIYSPDAIILGDNTSLTVETSGGGKPGNIDITTNILTIGKDAKLSATTTVTSTNQETGGNINLNANEINLSGKLGIFAETQSIAPAGNLTIQPNNTSNLSINFTDNGFISARTFASGQGGNIEINAPETLDIGGQGKITVETEGSGNAGNITLNSRTLNLADRLEITASTTGMGNAGNITLNGDRINLSQTQINAFTNKTGNAGSISLANQGNNASQVTLSKNSRISSEIQAQGQASQPSNIEIKTNNLAVDHSVITASTQGKGDAGNITVPNAQTINLNQSEITASTSGQGNTGKIDLNANQRLALTNAQINSAVQQGAVGNSQQITLNTPKLSLYNSTISAATAGQGNAGSIVVPNAQTVTLDKSTISTSIEPTGIATQPSNITLNTQQLALDNAQITASTSGQGDAGNIAVKAKTVSLNNRSAITTTVNPNAIGQGGNITIQTTGNTVILSDRSQISSRSQGRGKAGNITITSQGDIILTDSDITTDSAQTAGGAIALTARNIRLNGDSNVRTNVASGAGGGGNITLTADSILAFGDSDILAFARDGQGGNIGLNTLFFLGEGFQSVLRGVDPNSLDGNNRVDINASGVVSGIITLPDLSFIRNSLTDLPENLIDIDNLIANSCVVPNHPETGTFIVTGAGGLPTRPGDRSVSAYPTGRVRPLLETSASSRPWQVGDHIIEPQGVYRLGNGQLVLVRECL